MRNRLLGSLTALLAGSGFALAQAPGFPVLVFKADPALLKNAAPMAAPVKPAPLVTAPAPPPVPQTPTIIPATAPAASSGNGVNGLTLPTVQAQPDNAPLPLTPQPAPAMPAKTPDNAPAASGTQTKPATQAQAKPAADNKKKPVELEPFGPFRDLDGPVGGLCGRFYANADYLLWFAKGMRLPPLVTSGSAADGIGVPVTDLAGNTVTSVTLAAALGSPGTHLLLGNSDVNENAQSGGRGTAGFWLNADRTVGIEVSGFYLDPESSRFHVQSNGPTAFGIPVTTPLLTVGNDVRGPETAILAVEPGVSSGSIDVFARTRLWGAEANSRINVKGDSCSRFDLLVGFRYLNLEDDLRISSSSQPIAPNNTLRFQGVLVTGATDRTVIDSFNTSNEYYGGQIGAEAEFYRGNWYMNVYGKAALGVMRQTVTIHGLSSLTTPTGTTVLDGGNLAQATNSGHHARDEFGFVPEAGINLGYQFGSHLRAYVGYTFLYAVSDIVRAGDQIDRTVDFRQVPRFLSSNQIIPGTNTVIPVTGTPTRPQFGFRDGDFWVQGLNAGIAIGF